ncbi:MAG: sulfurtransferase [Gammaproteobacteria bacterium]|jgi:thiosulfate/3-mercaptopyruvate sulfurtransferase|nr:sulfurtransferase [Gammaproteobacteria bacterium]MBT7369652.1 sulfurtransferase [Gammaproteobacteria bacterium]
MPFPNLLALLFFLCFSSFSNAEPPGDKNDEMSVLVSADWLNRHLDDPDLVVLDCSIIVTQEEDGTMQNLTGRSSYDSGHIPSAGFADLLEDLSDTDSPYLFKPPTPEQFAAAMSALGVGDETRVVLYDNSNSAWAARVWWMLRWIGFDNAALLDGGLNAWKAQNLPLSTDAPTRPVRELSIAIRPELIADRDEVLAAINDDSTRIIDALPGAHYRGDFAMYARPGHIVSAENRSIALLQDENGRYRTEKELATMFTGDRNTRAITYCGGGIAASSVAFTMHRLGFSNISVYAASLQEWAENPENPMETVDPMDWQDD